MYTPKNLQMTEADAIHRFISEFGFGTLLSQDLDATRLPLILDASQGNKGTIIGHMARANPQWKTLSGKRASVLFDGPHSYISPTWYVSRPAVPTWNYASVQCFGVFQMLNSSDTLLAIDAVVRKYEPEVLGNITLMPTEYTDKLLKAVVGFKIEIDDIHAKEKLGQHKSIEDQQSVFAALVSSQHRSSIELAEYMKRRQLGIGSD